MKKLIPFLFSACLSTLLLANDLDQIYDEARSYWNRDWEKCIGLLEEALPLAEQKFGKIDEYYVTILNDLAVAYWHTGDLNYAEELLNEAIDVAKELYGEDDPNFANTLANAAGIYDGLGDRMKAKELFEQSLVIYNTADDNQGEEYIATLNSFGRCMEMAGLYLQAEEKFYDALDVAELSFGDNSPLYASVLNNLGNLYTKTGNYSDAEDFLNQALDILYQDIDNNKQLYSDALTNLGLLYETSGAFGEAEQVYLEVLDIQRAENEQSAEHAKALGNLGVLYKRIGNYSKAETYMLKSRELYAQSLGENHADYGVATNNLAEVSLIKGNLEEAEELYTEASLILLRAYNDLHPLYGTTLNNLASIYRRTGRYDEALKLYQQSMKIDEITVGKDHPIYATTLNNLGLLYFSMGRFSEAQPFFEGALEIRKNKLGEKHPAYSRSLSNLGLFHLSQENVREAEPLFIKSILAQKEQIRSVFPALSEREKEDYYNTIKEDVERFNTIAILRSTENPSILGEMYNNQLATKAILFNASDKIRRNILTSGDQELINLFNKWRRLKSDLATYYQYSLAELEAQKIDLEVLERTANTIEKNLSQKSETFAAQSNRNFATWQEIRDKLSPNEVAVEIIRFREFKSVKSGGRFGFSNKVYYAALIVTSNTSSNPELVLFDNGNDLESKYFSYFRNAFRFRVEDWYSYDQFWRKIEDKFTNGIERVYFSPDGVYNKINLNALLNRETGKYVIDLFDIDIVTNTGDFLEEKSMRNTSNKIVLFGNPDFMIDPATRQNIISDGFSSRHNTDDHNYEHYHDINYGLKYLSDLPGSVDEIETIVEVVGDKGWSDEVYLGANAMEEVVKRLESPKILHIATHGFFSESKLSQGYIEGVSVENPLFKTGLMLSGSGNTLYREGKGLPISRELEDGILTAFEAMNLNLDGTDLVVLSACETGLGDVKNGEGVYGLERAFKVAGAEAIVISLFKVDDFATKALMALFYDEWIKTEDKRLAFKKAQLTFRESYPDPYYWAPFVMIGG
jgi:CHAT domain-containing protein/tetratricopeptide (TPR) repeat protein